MSSIDDARIGKFTLATSPKDSDRFFITYYASPVDMVTPHKLVKLACIKLAAALTFTGIDVKKIQSYRVGKIAVMKQSQAYDIYRRQYIDTLNRIRQEMFKVARGTKTL